jgi:hypothetical protein
LNGAASSATNATFANSATNATFANSATNASAATNATFANSATNATFASSATNATFASSATNASAATNATFATTAGNGVTATSGSPAYYGARAWVNFNGTGTVAIRASVNVSSITDNGTGDYTVNFTTAMPDANYSADIAASNSSGNSATMAFLAWHTTAPTTSAARFRTANDAGTLFDMPYVCVTIFR